MTFIDYAKNNYYSKEYLNDINNLVNTKLNNNIKINNFEFARPIKEIISKTPSSYWLQDVYEQSYNTLELFSKRNQLLIDEEIIDFFFIGLNTYYQITDTINDLSSLNDTPIIKNRQYRLPTYISIVEGCLTNLFKFICLLINQISDKDYSKLNKLNNLCEALTLFGFDKSTQNIDVDIRNAINHGGVIFLEDGIKMVFRFSKNNKSISKTLTMWELDRSIEKAYDTASALILSILSFLNNNSDLLSINLQDRNYITFNYLSLKLSNDHIKCEYINDIENNKQINISTYTEKMDKNTIFTDSIYIALLIYDIYKDYDKYFIGFRNERMQGGWIIFSNEQISDILLKNKESSEVIKDILSMNNALIFPPSTESIDLLELKSFRFPNYFDSELTILDVTDASLADRKRLRCNIFIGNKNEKKEILKLIDKAITWLLTLKNVDSPTIHRKNGVMEADCLYINVYKNNERKNKGLLTSNDNFICFVDYNKNGQTTLKNGGILKSIWDKLYKEQIGNLKYAWRESKYFQSVSKKIGVNSPCPCGSGKKFKKCCRGKRIYN